MLISLTAVLLVMQKTKYREKALSWRVGWFDSDELTSSLRESGNCEGLHSNNLSMSSECQIRESMWGRTTEGTAGLKSQCSPTLTSISSC